MTSNPDIRIKPQRLLHPKIPAAASRTRTPYRTRPQTLTSDLPTQTLRNRLKAPQLICEYASILGSSAGSVSPQRENHSASPGRAELHPDLVFLEIFSRLFLLNHWMFGQLLPLWSWKDFLLLLFYPQAVVLICNHGNKRLVWHFNCVTSCNHCINFAASWPGFPWKRGF